MQQSHRILNYGTAVDIARALLDTPLKAVTVRTGHEHVWYFLLRDVEQPPRSNIPVANPLTDDEAIKVLAIVDQLGV